jgi:hypothetical protein
MNRLETLKLERDEILARLLVDPSDDVAYFDLQDVEGEIADAMFYDENTDSSDQLDAEEASDVVFEHELDSVVDNDIDAYREAY